MDRRQFLVRLGGITVAVPATLQLIACGSDDDDGTADAATGGGTFTVSSTQSGHTHMITVRCADLTSSGDVTYTSTTGSGHTHEVTISAAQLSQINGGQSVTIMTTDLHPHSWTVATPSSACS